MGSEGFAERDRREVLVGVAAAALLSAAPVRAARAEHAIAEMIRRGEARDAAVRRAFPFGKPDGTSPYVLSQRHGAWLDLRAPDAAEKLDEETGRLRADAARGIVPPAFILDAVIDGAAGAAGARGASAAACGAGGVAARAQATCRACGGFPAAAHIMPPGCNARPARTGRPSSSRPRSAPRCAGCSPAPTGC
jgi:hypothetical protein